MMANGWIFEVKVEELCEYGLPEYSFKRIDANGFKTLGDIYVQIGKDKKHVLSQDAALLISDEDMCFLLVSFFAGFPFGRNVKWPDQEAKP